MEDKDIVLGRTSKNYSYIRTFSSVSALRQECRNNSNLIESLFQVETAWNRLEHVKIWCKKLSFQKCKKISNMDFKLCDEKTIYNAKKLGCAE